MFGFVPLSALQMAAIIAIVAGYIGATETAKAWFFCSVNAVEPSKQAHT
jgi:Mg2+-importing ATPase